MLVPVSHRAPCPGRQSRREGLASDRTQPEPVRGSFVARSRQPSSPDPNVCWNSRFAQSRRGRRKCPRQSRPRRSASSRPPSTLAIHGHARSLTYPASGWELISTRLAAIGVERIGLEATGGYERGIAAHLRDRASPSSCPSPHRANLSRVSGPYSFLSQSSKTRKRTAFARSASMACRFSACSAACQAKRQTTENQPLGSWPARPLVRPCWHIRTELKLTGCLTSRSTVVQAMKRPHAGPAVRIAGANGQGPAAVLGSTRVTFIHTYNAKFV
jgi:hypothetical protein